MPGIYPQQHQKQEQVYASDGKLPKVINANDGTMTGLVADRSGIAIDAN